MLRSRRYRLTGRGYMTRKKISEATCSHRYSSESEPQSTMQLREPHQIDKFKRQRPVRTRCFHTRLGRALTIRGYQEDSQDTFPPHTIFDTTLPTWRLGEALLHAEALAGFLAQDKDKIKVRLRVLYTGAQRTYTTCMGQSDGRSVHGRGCCANLSDLDWFPPKKENTRRDAVSVLIHARPQVTTVGKPPRVCSPF
jgi:hypothetical protein